MCSKFSNKDLCKDGYYSTVYYSKKNHNNLRLTERMELASSLETCIMGPFAHLFNKCLPSS